MNQARQRAPQGEGRFGWANPGRVDVAEGEVQGRVARRPPVAFRPPKPVARLPRPVHEEPLGEEWMLATTETDMNRTRIEVLKLTFMLVYIGSNTLF